MHQNSVDKHNDLHNDLRNQPRVATDCQIKLLTQDSKGKRLVINFKAKNISQSGFCLHPNEYPAFKNIVGNAKPFHMVILLTLTETTIRMYHVNAYPVHRGPQGCGFFFVRRYEQHKTS